MGVSANDWLCHGPLIRTPRLLLRPWRESDREPFAALGQDASVMRLLMGVISREESDGLVDEYCRHCREHGYAKLVVECVEPGFVSPFIGYVGFTFRTYEAHFTPAIDVAWRLATSHQGRGYATEAARAVMRYGFEVLGFSEIVSMTVEANRASWHVMEKLGMTRNPDEDYDHPHIPPDHPLRRHMLYRIPRSSFASCQKRSFRAGFDGMEEA